jgi:hypothetical protein
VTTFILTSVPDISVISRGKSVYVLLVKKFVLLWLLHDPARAQEAILMLSFYKGKVHTVGLARVSRAQEAEHITDRNTVALAAQRRCTGNQFLRHADLNASS